MLNLIFDVNIHNFASLITLGFLIFIITFPYHIPLIEAQSLKIDMLFLTVPAYDDAVYGSCESKEYLFLFGWQLKDFTSYVRFQIKFKSNGTLVKELVTRDYPLVVECIIINDKLYAIGGNWQILVFDLNLNLISFVNRSLRGSVNSIAFYNGYLFIAGWEDVNFDEMWRVEKWRIEDLKLVKEYTSNPTPWVDMAIGIGVNPVTEQLWVLGQEDYYGNFRIKIFDLELNLLKTISRNYSRGAIAVVFDEDGFAYVLSESSYVTKYDKFGNEVKGMGIEFSDKKLLYINGYLYIAGWKFIDDHERPVLYIYDKELNQIDSIILSWNLNVDAHFFWGDMIFDGKNLYITGWDGKKGYWGWILCTISIIEKTSNITSEKLKQPKCIIPSASAESWNDIPYRVYLTEPNITPLVWYIVGIVVTVTIITLSLLWIKRKRTKLNKHN